MISKINGPEADSPEQSALSQKKYQRGKISSSGPMVKSQSSQPALPKEEAKQMLTKEKRNPFPKQSKISSQDAERNAAAAESKQGNRFMASSRKIDTEESKYPRIRETVEFAADWKQKKPPNRPEIQKTARRNLCILRGKHDPVTEMNGNKPEYLLVLRK